MECNGIQDRRLWLDRRAYQTSFRVVDVEVGAVTSRMPRVSLGSAQATGIVFWEQRCNGDGVLRNLGL